MGCEWTAVSFVHCHQSARPPLPAYPSAPSKALDSMLNRSSYHRSPYDLALTRLTLSLSQTTALPAARGGRDLSTGNRGSRDIKDVRVRGRLRTDETIIHRSALGKSNLGTKLMEVKLET